MEFRSLESGGFQVVAGILPRGEERVFAGGRCGGLGTTARDRAQDHRNFAAAAVRRGLCVKSEGKIQVFS